jgi:hypothetical protein
MPIEMLSEVPSGGLGAGRVAPFDLAYPGQCVTQVRNVEISLGIMMREMSELPSLGALGGGFDRRKGRIGKLPDESPGPLRCIG